MTPGPLMVGDSREVPARSCPECRRELDGATQIGGPGADPEPGDVSLCIYCAAALVFTAEGFEVIPAGDVAELEAVNLAFRMARAAVRDRIRQEGDPR